MFLKFWGCCRNILVDESESEVVVFAHLYGHLLEVWFWVIHDILKSYLIPFYFFGSAFVLQSFLE